MALSLDESDGGFVLRKTSDDGTVYEMVLSDDDVLTLGQSAPGFRQRILAKHSRESGGQTAVYATKVVQIGLAPDTLSEDVLLTLVAPNGGQTTFAVSPHIARHLAERLPVHASMIENEKMTRQ
jgi:hypothetical protein